MLTVLAQKVYVFTPYMSPPDCLMSLLLHFFKFGFKSKTKQKQKQQTNKDRPVDTPNFQVKRANLIFRYNYLCENSYKYMNSNWSTNHLWCFVLALEPLSRKSVTIVSQCNKGNYHMSTKQKYIQKQTRKALKTIDVWKSDKDHFKGWQLHAFCP